MSETYMRREPLRIGFIGLGMMGLPMLENLASHDAFHILAFDTQNAPFDKLATHPAWGTTLTRATALDEFASVEMVITMLPNSVITNAVIAGDADRAGLAGVLAPDSIVIDMGSSNPGETQKLAELLASAGSTLVDAPVSGAVAKARSGTLTIMAGGPDAACERARPVLEKMGTNIIRTGKVASAHAMKALNNYVYAAGLLAASEALLIASRLDLDLTRFAEVLNASSGRNVATETKLNQFIIPGTFAGGFALRLQAKDIATAAALQSLTGIDAPQLNLCNSVWADAISALEPGADNTEIFRFLQQRNEATADS
ncbi:6-phosphogluconate dehydrogenase [Caballeronia hypogeia]|uniref:6-phosphogluconate dehydrogenase n=1 Tax=Caballeronia hypogeia TaxID=1777140 RepID=A0A158DML4_9BURK|nr:NAD(P)-dependent oxidoreductase [Caballeronia hypogeia]SAK95849.1 6-phosphogluconate dehydrogenase [Caballeronia hypogeia]